MPPMVNVESIFWERARGAKHSVEIARKVNKIRFMFGILLNTLSVWRGKDEPGSMQKATDSKIPPDRRADKWKEWIRDSNPIILFGRYRAYQTYHPMPIILLVIPEILSPRIAARWRFSDSKSIGDRDLLGDGFL